MRRLLIVGLVGLILLVAGTVVLAKPDTAVATLVVTEGQATVTQSRTRFGVWSTETAVPVAAGSFVTVSQEDVIQQESGVSQLRLQDGTTIDLAAGTRLVVAELILTSTSYKVQLQLLAGQVTNRVVKLLDAEDYFRVSTPSSTAAVRGTVFSVTVLSQTGTHVAVDEGMVQVTMGTNGVDVLAGQMVTAVIGQPLQVLPQTGDSPVNNVPTINGAGPTLDLTTHSGSPLPTAILATGSTASGMAVQSTAVPPPTGTPPLALPTLTAPAGGNPTHAAPAPTTSTPSAPTVPTLPTPTQSQPATPTTSSPVTMTPLSTIMPSATAPQPSVTNTPLPTAVPSATAPQPPTATQLPTVVPPPTATPSPEPPSPPVLVTLCHIPLGNPDNRQTIQVAPSAVEAHLAHGDYLGPCQ